MNAALDELKTLPLQRYPPGGVICEQGHTDGKVHFLEKGSVQVLKNGVLVAEVSEPGAVFGEMAILLKIPHTATVTALEESHLYVVDEPEEFLRRYPEAVLHVARILAKRLDSLNRYLVDVKSQFRDFDDHVGMVDEVLDSLMAKHPRELPHRDPGEYD